MNGTNWGLLYDNTGAVFAIYGFEIPKYSIRHGSQCASQFFMLYCVVWNIFFDLLTLVSPEKKISNSVIFEKIHILQL